MLELITTENLAKTLGYSGPNSAFREWCVLLQITPVPGRRGFYDPKLVRRRLDEAQDLLPSVHPQNHRKVSLVQQRKARLAAK